MVNITKETYENNEIDVIIDKFGKLWLHEKHSRTIRTWKVTCTYKQMMKNTKNADMN